MANKNETEISLMKAASVMLDDETIFTLAYLVHTEEHKREKSEYIFSGRVDKVKDLEAEANEMDLDANKLKSWVWKGLQNYTSCVYDGHDTNTRGSRWLKSRIKKATKWDDFEKTLKGWKKSKKAYNENAKYAVDDYVLDDGTQLKNILEAKDQLKNYVGHTMTHKVQLKRQSV